MPFYDYVCYSCEMEFEEFHKIDDRKIPCEIIPHPDCDNNADCNIHLKFGATAFGYDSIATKTHKKKPDDGFRDVLRNLKSKHRGSTINTFD